MCILPTPIEMYASPTSLKIAINFHHGCILHTWPLRTSKKKVVFQFIGDNRLCCGCNNDVYKERYDEGAENIC